MVPHWLAGRREDLRATQTLRVSCGIRHVRIGEGVSVSARWTTSASVPCCDRENSLVFRVYVRQMRGLFDTDDDGEYIVGDIAQRSIVADHVLLPMLQI